MLTGLAKGKRVTVKVRAYKTVGSTKYYTKSPSWSATASARVLR